MRCQLDNQTRATIKWDVATFRFPIASVRRLTIQGAKVVFGKKCSYIENTDGNRTELVVQGIVFWLKAKVLEEKVDSKLVCSMESVEMRALEEQAVRLGLVASACTMQPHDRKS